MSSQKFTWTLDPRIEYHQIAARMKSLSRLDPTAIARRAVYRKKMEDLVAKIIREDTDEARRFADSTSREYPGVADDFVRFLRTEYISAWDPRSRESSAGF